MKAIVFDHFGEPGEVLQVRDVPVPEPGRGQVRVRVIASPINPCDLLVVRRREQGEELQRLGGDAVICSPEESIEERVRAITGGAGVRYALDAVGGAMGSAAAAALGNHGRMLVYGTLAGEPLTLPPRVL